MGGGVAASAAWLHRRRGCIGGVAASAAWLHRRRGCIGALEVEPTLRGRGIGRALTLRALDEAVTRGFAEVTLNVEPANEAARELYRALGFEEFRDTKLRWQGEEFEVESLMLDLDAAT